MNNISVLQVAGNKQNPKLVEKQGSVLGQQAQHMLH